jgi:hypothetical protein
MIHFIPSVLLGQSIVRKVIATAGTSVKVGNIQVDYTVGEPVINTLSAGSFVLTQGFQQGDPVISATHGLPENVSLKISPNPTSGEVLVELAGPEIDCYAGIFTIFGQPVSDLEHQFIGAGKQQTRFNLSRMPSGAYHVVFMDSSGKLLTSVTVIRL